MEITPWTSQLQKKKKVVVNMTIDEDLKKEIDDFKKKHGIKELSPVINQMLWDWIKNNKKMEGKK